MYVIFVSLTVMRKDSDKVDNLELTYEHNLTNKIYASVTPWINWRTNSGGDHYLTGYRNMGVKAGFRLLRQNQVYTVT